MHLQEESYELKEGMMARRQVSMSEIAEILYHWHQGKSIQGIKRSFGTDRKTIRHYIRLGQAAGLRREDPFPEESELAAKIRGMGDETALRKTPARDRIVVHREWMEELLKDPEMRAKQVWRLLRELKGVSVGYCTVKRYLRAEFGYREPPVTVRMEVEAGSQAQVDFGYVGKMPDPETRDLRKTWAFVMTLSYSRHRFVRLLFRPEIRSWIDCHRRAFEFFGGVPDTVVIDNLKTGVIKPDLYDPTLNRAYGEMERHYRFTIDPTRIRTPRHKGKVERAIPGIRQQLLAGRTFQDIDEANRRALLWCKDEIGMEVHGTTQRKPYEVFVREELPKLKSLPAEPLECADWKKGTVHPDHHLVFQRSYYSVPTRYIGREVWVRGDGRLVRIFLGGELIKTHTQADRPGTWCTDPSDYPPEKLAYLMRTPTYCRTKAAEVGPETQTLVEAILGDHAIRNLRKAQAILRLAEKHGSAAMEGAAKRAVFFGNLQYQSIKKILERGWNLDRQQLPPALPLSELGQRFLRPPEYFAAQREVTP
jgi:transposase